MRFKIIKHQMWTLEASVSLRSIPTIDAHAAMIYHNVWAKFDLAPGAKAPRMALEISFSQSYRLIDEILICPHRHNTNNSTFQKKGRKSRRNGRDQEPSMPVSET